MPYDVCFYFFLQQARERKMARTRFENTMRASVRVTKFLETWGIDKPFANLQTSSVVSKVLSLTVRLQFQSFAYLQMSIVVSKV